MSDSPWSIDISRKAWLADLVERDLAGYDPAAARLRLPREVREEDPDGPSLEARARILVVRSLRRRLVEPAAARGEAGEVAAFLAPVQGHVGLLLDLALVQGGPFEAARRQAELAGLFAAAAGEVPLAEACLPDLTTGKVFEANVRQAFARAGAALLRRGFPPGDPAGGIRLYAGTLAVERRLLARLALAYYRRGILDEEGAHRHIAFAEDELALLVEALSGLASADGPLDARRRRTVERQIARLRLPKARERAARSALLSPRPAGEVARDAPGKMRGFLVEQLLLSTLGVPATAARAGYIADFAEAAQIGPEQLAAMQVEAAAFHADHKQWFEAFGMREPPEWEALAGEWNPLGEHMLERVAAIVTQNLAAIATEIRETGELGQLLATAAAGHPLTAAEKRKVKEQLIDLAKAVPALAIFAAPGGALLLPLLARLLPFNLLPGAFQSAKGRKAALGTARNE